LALQCATRDITERRRAGKEKLNFEAELRQSQELGSVGTLGGGIAHDFNNLLFPIIGLSEMLLEYIPADSSLRGNVAKIYEAAQRAGKLVNPSIRKLRSSCNVFSKRLFS
jgi:signal transduction histidine kinase